MLKLITFAHRPFVDTLVIAGVKHVTFKLWKDFFHVLPSLNLESAESNKEKQQTVHKLQYKDKDG